MLSVFVVNRRCVRMGLFHIYLLHGLTVFECLSVLQVCFNSFRLEEVGTYMDTEFLRIVESKLAYFASECGDYVFYCTQGSSQPPPTQHPLDNDRNHEMYKSTLINL